MAGGKAWLITGASQGLGYHLALAALARGHRVALTARRPEQAQDLADRHPATAIVVPLDVTDQAQVCAAVAATEEFFGGIDVLVNNAGVGFIGAIEEADPAEYRALFDINVFGAIEMTRAALPGMRRRGSGHIVNISSSGGIAASAGHGYYCATKFAIEGLSETLASEVGALGIGVTIVEPGSFRTNFRGTSLRCAARIIEAYAESSGAARTLVPQSHGQQSGDPRRAAAVIVEMVEQGRMPLRLLLGADCLARVDTKIAMLTAARNASRADALSTDFASRIG